MGRLLPKKTHKVGLVSIEEGMEGVYDCHGHAFTTTLVDASNSLLFDGMKKMYRRSVSTPRTLKFD